MDLTLIRKEKIKTGIFGIIPQLELVTLEHAYLEESKHYEPKVPAGVYECLRGRHSLEHIPNSFEAFEVMDVPGHSNILIHVGNYNEDSEGCILIGTYSEHTKIIGSRVGFEILMRAQKGVDSFKLTVQDSIKEG